MPERRQRALVVALLLVSWISWLPVAAIQLDEFDKATSAIRCDCGCHPQSVKDCACGRADQMREEIAALIDGTGGAAPMTGAAVIAKYVADKGEQSLIAPMATGFNLLAWIGPIVALVLGLMAAVLAVRRLSATREPLPAGGAPEVPVPAAADDDEVYRERLRRQLEEWE